MRLLIYRKKDFPSHDLILPACKVSKRYCTIKNQQIIKIEDLKELQRKGYEFKYKIKDWNNLQAIPVIGKLKMFGIFRKQNKTKPILRLPIVRDFHSYTGVKILYKSEEYFEIMNRKLRLSSKGFRSHPLLFDIMVKEDQLYYIGMNQGFIKVA